MVIWWDIRKLAAGLEGYTVWAFHLWVLLNNKREKREEEKKGQGKKKKKKGRRSGAQEEIQGSIQCGFNS